jgi:hypothetical protein
MRAMHGTRRIIGVVFSTVFVFAILSFIAFYPAYHLTRLAPRDSYYTKPHFLFQDYYYYLSMIKQGRSGISGMNRYTTDPLPPQNFHVYYEFLGQAANVIGVTDPVMYYLGIAAGLFLFVLTALLFITTLVPRGYRMLAGLFVFFASPFPGWWVPVFGTNIYVGIMDWTKTDLWRRHAMVPHHIMGVSITVMATWFLLRFVRRKNLWEAGVAAVLYSVASLVFPVPVFLYGAAFCLVGVGYGAYYGYLLLRKKISVQKLWHMYRNEKTLGIGFCLIGILTCSTLFFKLHQPFTAELAFKESQISRFEQFPFLFSVFVLSQGILLLFYPFAVWRIKRTPKFSELFLISIIVTPWILYFLSGWGISGINKFRLVFTGPYLYGGILATLGVATVVQSVKKRFRGFIVFGTAALILATTVGGIDHWVSETQPKDYYLNIYIPRQNMEAVAYLNNQIPMFSHILSTFYTGMYLPAYTNAIVYVGHEFSTPNFQEKFFLSEQFFRGMMPMDTVRQFLKDNGIEYVFWDVPERPDRYNDFFQEVFRNESVTIFKVVGIAKQE